MVVGMKGGWGVYKGFFCLLKKKKRWCVCIVVFSWSDIVKMFFWYYNLYGIEVCI